MITLFKNFNIKHKLKECVRILKISKKPSKEEFKEITKITGYGLIIIGLLGFMIQAFKYLVDYLV